MAHYVIFTKVVTLTLTFIRFQKKKIGVVHEPEYIICQKIRTINPVVWPVDRELTDRQTNKQTDRQTDRQTAVTNILCKNLRFCKVTNRGDQYTLQKSTILQSNERALRECILCKIRLTDWVIYLVDWQWQRSRTQLIGPNDSNEKCTMSRVLFVINMAAIQKIRDLDLLHLTLTFFLDLWPWYLTLRLIYYYLDVLKKTLQKYVCYFSLIDVIFCKIHSIGPYVYTFWEKSVDYWRFYEKWKIVCFLWRHVTPKRKRGPFVVLFVICYGYTMLYVGYHPYVWRFTIDTLGLRPRGLCWIKP